MRKSIEIEQKLNLNVATIFLIQTECTRSLGVLHPQTPDVLVAGPQELLDVLDFLQLIIKHMFESGFLGNLNLSNFFSTVNLTQTGVKIDF